MENTILKNIIAAALAGGMAMSCASCMLIGGPNKKAIVEAADTFAGTLLKQDAGKIVKLTNEKKDSDAAEALEILFDESMYSDEQNEFNKAVADTISYEVDEESVEVDKEEASVEVVFTMVDYEKALKDDYSDIDEVLDLIDDCDDTKEVTITFEFEKDDDEWLLSNLKDKGFGKLFGFYEYELDIMGELFDMFSYSDTVAGDWYVDSWFYFDGDISAYEGLVYFDVYYNGSVILSAQTADVYDTFFYCTYEDPDYNDLPAGDYYFSVYCNDTYATSDTVTIEQGKTPAVTVDDTFIFPGVSGLITEVYFIDDITAYESRLTYDVYFNGNLLASNLAAVVADTNVIWCDYATELETGEYEIVVYLDGVELTSMSTTFDDSANPTVTDDTVSFDDLSFDFTADGQLGDLVQAVDWYLDDGSGYYKFNSGIEYDIYFSDALTYDDVVGITFNIYDEDGNTLAEGEADKKSNISYGTNEYGYYYVYLTYQTENGLESGTYYIEVFNPDGTTLLTDYCVVQ